MEIREPQNRFKDFDTVIGIIANMQDDKLRTHAMPRNSTAVRAAGDASTLLVVRSDYSIYMGFTLTGLVLEEYGYHLIKRKIFKNTDLVGFNCEGRRATFTLKADTGSTYGLQGDSFTLDFDDLSKSTPELFDADKLAKDYRIIPDEVRSGKSYAA